MKRFILVFLTIAVLSTLAYAKNNYLIVPGSRVGIITPTITEAELVKKFGAENVISTTELNEKNEVVTVTTIYPYDLIKKLVIYWNDGNSKTGPALVRIEGLSTLWHTADGISLGTTLADLEALNGASLNLTGFNLDYPGIITDCGNGKLKCLGTFGSDDKVKVDRSMILRLNQPYIEHVGVTPEELLTISGDGIYSSNHDVMKRLNPVVYRLDVTFP